MKQMTIKERLIEGNRSYLAASDKRIREQAAVNGQHPYAIVICCSDSRVIPSRFFLLLLGSCS